MGQNTPSNLQIVGMESDRGQDNSREKTIAARHGSHFAETHSFRRDAHLAEIVMPSQTVTDTRDLRRDRHRFRRLTRLAGLKCQ